LPSIPIASKCIYILLPSGSYFRAFATGVHECIFGFDLYSDMLAFCMKDRHSNHEFPSSTSRLHLFLVLNVYCARRFEPNKIITHVLYVRNADRPNVNVGLCSFGSHTLTPPCAILSTTGASCVMYDIQACQPGSIWEGSNSLSL
jgi:hypothetical protein